MKLSIRAKGPRLAWMLPIAVACVLPVALAGGTFLAAIATTVLLWFAVAESWNWIGGYAGAINLGQYIFFGIGAYVFAIGVAMGIAPVAAGAMAVVLSMLVAVVISWPLFRLHGDYFALATLALLPLFQVISSNLAVTGGANGLSIATGRAAGREAFSFALGLAVLCSCLGVWISRSRFGFGLKAVGDDERAAAAVGVPIFKMKMAVLVLSSATTSAAGAIMAWHLSFIDPNTVFGLDAGLLPVAMVLLGGAGTVWGSFIGAFLLGSLQLSFAAKLGTLGTIFIGAVIFLVGRFAPGGLLGLLRERLAGRFQPVGGVEIAGAAVPGIGRTRGDDEPRARGLGGRGLVTQLSRRIIPAESSVDPGWQCGNNHERAIWCRGVGKSFGGNRALEDVSLAINRGEIVGLIGPNGAGKSTLFNILSGEYTIDCGSVDVLGRNVGRKRPDQLCRLGLARTFQYPRPFLRMSALENVAVAAMYSRAHRSVRVAMRDAYTILGHVGLGSRTAVGARRLGLQEQKDLELARAIASMPTVLLIDELASGLSRAEIDVFVQHVKKLRDDYGVTVVWVEHIFHALQAAAGRLVVLDHGVLIADGEFSAVVSNPDVMSAYFGAPGTDTARNYA